MQHRAKESGACSKRYGESWLSQSAVGSCCHYRGKRTSSSGGNPDLTNCHFFRHLVDQVCAPLVRVELPMAQSRGTDQGTKLLAQSACKSHSLLEDFAGCHSEFASQIVGPAELWEML